MNKTMDWQIKWRKAETIGSHLLPDRLLTWAPEFQHKSMPNEISLLLPTNKGAKKLIGTIVETPGISVDAILGLFLADPFLNLPLEINRLSTKNIRWIANLPTVGQQDTEFEQQLTDVGLDITRECRNLAKFKEHGFKIAAVISDMTSAKSVVPLKPEIIIILPRIVYFAAGFPSLRQRRSIAQEVFLVLQEAGWSGLLLGLGESTELDHEGQWPEMLNGLVCSPQISA